MQASGFTRRAVVVAAAAAAAAAGARGGIAAVSFFCMWLRGDGLWGGRWSSNGRVFSTVGVW